MCDKKVTYKGQNYDCGHQHKDGALICKRCAATYRAMGMQTQKAKRW